MTFPFIFKLSCTKLEFQLSFCMIKCSFSPYGKSLLLPFIVVMEKIYSGQLYIKQIKLNNKSNVRTLNRLPNIILE